MHSYGPPQTEIDAHHAETTLAKALAPEEIRPGDFVSRLYEVFEFPTFLWCCDSMLTPRDQPVRMRFVPFREPLPLKVKAVCLPFVLTAKPDGKQLTLDVRSSRLARLDPRYARVAWDAYRGRRRTKGKKRKRK